MWEVDRALAENTRFTQLEKGRWRAAYEGFVTVTAEGDSPTESERQLSRALDTLLATLIRGGKGPKKLDPDAVLSSSMLSDSVRVVNTTARRTAKWKRDSRLGDSAPRSAHE
jgi:predicted RNase H-like HicB family nuclease